MFVIEGADHLGKTTIAQKMVKFGMEDGRYPIRYAHMSRPGSAFNFGSDYLDMISKYAVQDRFHLGARVYHPEGTLSDQNLAMVKRWLDDVASVVVVVYAADRREYKRRLLEVAKVEMFPVDTILEANQRFYELALQGHCDIVHDVSSYGWVTDKQIQNWMNVWYDRMDRNANTRRTYRVV
jgi:hypothetical protein